MKKFLSLLFTILFVFSPTVSFCDLTPSITLSARSACLMEKTTGSILYAKNETTSLPPASITKIMTLILIFDALENGQITLQDNVTTSAHAKSMGGSQVFLEEGEVQTVETMLKCIVIASGNDASVAMAEHIAGTEENFVAMMNKRAKELSLTATHFTDCCGLTNDKTHLTSALDVAIMSRELLTKYPEITKYSTIWMENIIHETRQGRKEFGLTNTNKLLKMNAGFEVTGLKTGSTNAAKYCVSATARKNGVDLICVVMGAENYKVRFSEAQSLLNFGFASCKLYKDEKSETLEPIKISGALTDTIKVATVPGFSYLFLGNDKPGPITKTYSYIENLKAPVFGGDVVGKVTYHLGQKEIGHANIIAMEDVERAGFWDYFSMVFQAFLPF